MPSTGVLTASGGFIGSIHDGGSGSSGTLTIRGTSSATKATASILMTDGVASTTTTTGTLVVTGGVGISGQITPGSISTGGAILTTSSMTANSIVESSSITLKENIKPLTGSLDLILQLDSKMYDRKDGSMKNETGLIAEEVEKIIPWIVKKDSDGNPSGILYTRLVAYLIESVKELHSQIKILKNVV